MRCPRCGKNERKEGRSYCKKCENSYTQHKALERKEKSICACGQPTINGQSNCPSCLTKYKKRYYFRKDTGKCVDCGVRPKIETRSKCSYCLNHDRQRALSRKIKVLDHYGNKCACCGESSNILFLTIDHVNNDGAIHRKSNPKLKGGVIYNWLIDNNFPEGFQVLCWNCNLAKYYNKGICPHKEEVV